MERQGEDNSMAEDSRDKSEKRLRMDQMPLAVKRLVDTMIGIDPNFEIEDWLIQKANEDLALLKSSYMNDGNNGTEDTSPTFKAFEEGSETMSKEANTQLALRQEKFIRDLKSALIRIENKTYGVCRVTGNLIQKQRLLLVPHATLSIEAKNMQK